MQKLIKVELRGQKLNKDIFLPTSISNLNYEVSLIKNEIGDFEISRIESLDKDYLDLEFSNIKDLKILNKILYMDKRTYSLLVVTDFDMDYTKKVLLNKQYIFLNQIGDEESLGKTLFDKGFVGKNLREHFVLGYTEDGVHYDYNQIYIDFNSNGMRILNNDSAVMLLSNMDYKKYSHLLEDNLKDIGELECTYTALDIARDEDLTKQAAEYNIRKCSECGLYTSVYAMSGEKEIGEKTYYEICDKCSDMLEIGITSVYLEDDYYEDILDSWEEYSVEEELE